jgi:signal transduction histidine kinase
MKVHPSTGKTKVHRPPLSRYWEAVLGYLSFGTLLLVICYSFLQTQRPQFDFGFDPNSWKVSQASLACDALDCLRIGDQILAIDGLWKEEYQLERGREILTTPGPFHLRVKRNDTFFETTVFALERTWNRRLQQILLALLPLVFWLSGSAAFIFVRPHDDRWLVLVLYHLNMAVFFAAGGLSFTHMAYSIYVFHSVVWLFLPLSLHLHLILPNSIGRSYHRLLLVPTYITAFVLIAWDSSIPLTGDLFLPYAATALLVSAGLLLLRLTLPAPPAIRLATRLMAFGVLVGFGPWLPIVWILGQKETWPSNFNSLLLPLIAFLATPLWPLSYLYAIYRHKLGTIELRPNRLLGNYSFLVLYVTLFIATAFVASSRLLPTFENSIFPVIIVSACFIVATPFLASRFQRFVDRRLFGIHSSPEEIVSSFASKVPTAFDRESLARIIESEILPPFQIRQSALYLFEAEGVHCLIRDRISDDFEPTRNELEDLLSRSGSYLRLEQNGEHHTWIRLVLQLSTKNDNVGIWLLGQRDPDDFYSHHEIQLLEGMAGQMASMIRAQRDVIAKSVLEKQLVHAQKMEAVGRLTASVAHDFNNLLSAILGYGDLLLERVQDDTLARKYLAGILASGEKASGLTRQLLAYSRQQAAEVRIADLNTLVKEVEALISRLASEDIEFVLDLAPEAVLAEVDPGQVQQVLLNLAANAVDAMPKSGTLTIMTRNLPAATTAGTGEALLSVQDTGFGMPPEVAAQIFEPFYTTKGEGLGTGLGLAISREIVESFGGRIHVSSTPGVGTTFRTRFPLSLRFPPLKDLSTEFTSQTDIPKEGSETVLLAEDEEEVRLVVSQVLKNHGYTVLEARDGAEAMTVQAHHRGTIELLLTDIMMPHIKGPELAKRLHDDRPNTRVLFMSGYSDDVILRGLSSVDAPASLLP